MKTNEMILSVIKNYSSWLNKTLYNNEKPMIVELTEKKYKLIYNNFDINVICFDLDKQYGFCFDWIGKEGKLHREDGAATEYWAGSEDCLFRPYNHYFYLNGKMICQDPDLEKEIKEEKSIVILEKEKVSSLFWRTKYLTKNELIEVYLLDSLYQKFIVKRLYNLRIDSK